MWGRAPPALVRSAPACSVPGPVLRAPLLQPNHFEPIRQTSYYSPFLSTLFFLHFHLTHIVPHPFSHLLPLSRSHVRVTERVATEDLNQRYLGRGGLAALRRGLRGLDYTSWVQNIALCLLAVYLALNAAPLYESVLRWEVHVASARVFVWQAGPLVFDLLGTSDLGRLCAVVLVLLCVFAAGKASRSRPVYMIDFSTFKPSRCAPPVPAASGWRAPCLFGVLRAQAQAGGHVASAYAVPRCSC